MTREYVLPLHTGWAGEHCMGYPKCNIPDGFRVYAELAPIKLAFKRGQTDMDHGGSTMAAALGCVGLLQLANQLALLRW